MKTSHTPLPYPPRLFGLVDAAASPDEIYPLLEQSGAPFCSVYAGLPEEALGPASLFLVPINNTQYDWAIRLERIDLRAPCLSLIWSRIDMDLLATHLQAFLFADIGENMSALVRFFDPRCTDAVFRIWGDKVRDMFMAPIDEWLYRGRHEDWQRHQNASPTDAHIGRPLQIQFSQADIDALMAHTEPDELLAVLVENEVVDGERPYLERFADFIPRYQQARQWGLAEASERLVFCQRSYCYGADFDRHPRVRDLLSAHKTSGESLGIALLRIPAVIWEEIGHRHNPHTQASRQANADQLYG